MQAKGQEGDEHGIHHATQAFQNPSLPKITHISLPMTILHPKNSQATYLHELQAMCPAPSASNMQATNYNPVNRRSSLTSRGFGLKCSQTKADQSSFRTAQRQTNLVSSTPPPRPETK